MTIHFRNRGARGLHTLMRVVGAFMFLAASMAWGQPASILFESENLSYRISTNGTNLEFVDRASGIDYLRKDTTSPCAWVRIKGANHPATSASLSEGRLTLGFGGEGTISAVLRFESRGTYLGFTVESVNGADVDSFVFVNVPLRLEGRPDEPFGACAFSLNLITRVDALPALQRDLKASCYRRFGLVGAKAAIVGAPMLQMLPTLKRVLTESDEMPPCPVAGPWADEIPFNHGSYLFNFGSLTESNLDEWIATTRSLGVTQIDHHGGSGFFRFGDFVLRPEKWPNGWESFKRIVQRLHETGIGSIFHSYAFFIDKQSKYVTPIPDKRLDAFRTFTLSAPISADATELLVNEPTKGLSTVTGFFEHNSVLLHVDDELVTFSTVSQEAPWRFGGLKRGAFGTQAAAHGKAAQARHLKECFGLLVPDVDTSLFEEIAKNHAEIVNRCGFDGMYLDAIDGASILRGGDECWYWADKFVFEIQRHLRKPVGMEMSAMWHHFWQYRTRWQAWDYPQRGHKRFVDLHAQAVNGGLLLPLHLGWWNFQLFNPPQVEPTYPDVIEYLGAKLVGWNAGISLAGAIDPKRLAEAPLLRRAVDLLRQHEELRRAGAFSEAVRAKLREPGREFSLVRDAAGDWRFRPVHTLTRTVSAAEPWSLAWTVENPFERQPLRIRLEALMSTSSYDDPGNVTLFDSGDAEKLPPLRSAEGVSANLAPVPSSFPDKPVVLLSATHTGKVPRRGAWAALERRFDPVLDLKDHQALGLALEGGGLGEVIAVRLESPHHISFGAIADRYVTMDFKGWRTLTLVETESARWNDYVWNDGKSHYNVYRETIDFRSVDRVSLWINNLAPGQQSRCVLGPIKALRMLPCVVRNPTIAVNGTAVTLPAAIPSGGFAESGEQGEWTVYGPKGETVAKVTPSGPVPQLRAGANQVEFSCASTDNGPPPRARLVIFAQGPPLE
ncbi:MAG: hypothetical protein AB9869_38035 [Verrucomicrobiia bacterium]